MGQKSVRGGVSGSVSADRCNKYKTPQSKFSHLMGLIDDRYQNILSKPPPSKQTETYIHIGRSNKHMTVVFGKISLKIKEPDGL